MSPSRVLVCGSRTFSNRHAVEKLINALSDDDVVINGAAPGADSLAGSLARLRGLQVETYPADWKAYGKRAGFIRNQQMLEEGKPDVVYAFVDKPLDESKGTAMMTKIASEAGVPVTVVKRLTKVVHLRRTPYDIRIDRASPWGNIFVIGRDGDRSEVIRKYRRWLETDDPAAVWIRDNVHLLRDKALGCWCAPNACHGDVLAEMADDYEGQTA